MRTSRLFSLSLTLSAGLLAGCGGSSVGISSTPDASAGPTDGGTRDDGSLFDASAADTSTSDDGGGQPAEASIPDGGNIDGGDAGSCDTLATRAACISCCDTTYPGGLSTFDVAVEECACAASLCGPTDAGPHVGDAGDFGAGECTSTCGTTTPPKAECEKCILDTLGTTAAPGPCRSTVTAACASSTACRRYVACTDGCAAM
jgi:hypothetical protein